MPEETNTSVLGTLNSWPASRKMSLIGLALLTIAFFVIIIVQAQVADTSLLFANLSSNDAATVVDWLKTRNISYELQDGGKAIYVPADKVYEARLALAGEGLPSGGGIGFEIFDKQNFGMTDFAQKVNYRRALQGELSRTIASLAPVEGARVHLAIPEKRLFRSEQQQATASVILQLNNGRQLSSNQIQGIVYLVASSVEGLEAENVTVVDSSGKVLSRDTAAADDVNSSPGMLNHQLSLESRLEQRAQALLDRALGAGNAMVQITAKIDYRKRERVEEIYDPARTAVVSEQVTEEKSATPVQTAQTPQGANAPAPSSDTSSKTEETTNYEVTKVINKLVEPVGTLEHMSVSVLVADKVTANDKGETSIVPRTADELKNIEQMVRSALGLDETRGDQISVVSMPFETELFTEPVAPPAFTDNLYKFLPYLKYLLIAVGVLLFYRAIVKPLLVTASGGGGAKQVQPFRTVGELEHELNEPGALAAARDPAERLRRQLMQSQSSPTQVVKAWLQEN